MQLDADEAEHIADRDEAPDAGHRDRDDDDGQPAPERRPEARGLKSHAASFADSPLHPARKDHS